MNWFLKQAIVVPVDFSPESIEAVSEAIKLAGNTEQVHVIHVLPVLTVTEPGVIWETVDDESRCLHAKESLDERFAGDINKGISIHVAIGDPGHEIAEFAQQQEASLIVMPSHGRTGLQRLLIGSTAERVVRLSHCPVLVLRK